MINQILRAFIPTTPYGGQRLSMTSLIISAVLFAYANPTIVNSLMKKNMHYFTTFGTPTIFLSGIIVGMLISFLWKGKRRRKVRKYSYVLLFIALVVTGFGVYLKYF